MQRPESGTATPSCCRRNTRKSLQQTDFASGSHCDPVFDLCLVGAGFLERRRNRGLTGFAFNP